MTVTYLGFLFIYLFIIFLFFSFIFISWRLITLQYCSEIADNRHEFLIQP